MQDSLVDISASQHLAPKQDGAQSSANGSGSGNGSANGSPNEAASSSKPADNNLPSPPAAPVAAGATSTSDSTLLSGSTSLSSLSGSTISSLPHLHPIRNLYNRAARSFLQREYATTIACNDQAYRLAVAVHSSGRDAAVGGEELSARTKLFERIAVLRMTAYTTVFTASAAEQQACIDTLSKDPTVKISKEVSAETTQAAVQLLQSQPYELISTLWYNTLALFSPAASAELPSTPGSKIEPAVQTLGCILALPSSSLSSCILAALKVGDAIAQAPGGHKRGAAAAASARASVVVYEAARQICEWYIAAYTAASPSTNAASVDQQDKERIEGAYRKMIDLFTLQVLGAKFGEWDYAREMIGYSNLPSTLAMPFPAGVDAEQVPPVPAPGSKEELMEKLNALQNHEESKAERTRTASADLERAFEREKERRAEAAEQEAAAAAAAAATAASSSSVRSSSRNGTSKSRSATGSVERRGKTSPRRRRSDEETATLASSVSSIASNHSAASSSSALSSSSSSPTRETPPSSSSSPPSSTTSSATSTSAASSKPTEKRTRRSSGGSNSSSGGGAAASGNNFAESRASIAKTLERHHARDQASSSASAAAKASKLPAATTPKATSVEGIVAYLRDVYTQGSPTSLAIRYLSTLICVAFIFRRAFGRSGPGRTVGAGTGGSAISASGGSLAGTERLQSSAAALEARKRLQAKKGSERGVASWLWDIWVQVFLRLWRTVRMGTQVTYL